MCSGDIQEMGWQKLAEGSAIDALPDFEGGIPEGSKGRLELELRLTPPIQAINMLRSLLQGRGIPELQVYAENRTVVIEWRKAMPWLAVIVGGILGIIALLILVQGWRLFRGVEELLPEEIRPALGIVILAGLGLLVWSQGQKVVGGQI